MSLADDLLEQARHLANRERGRPRQASLRRAVSAAYYALFHLLTEEGAKLVTDPGLRALVRRAFSHSEMKRAARSLSSGGPLPAHVVAVQPAAIPAPLRDVARAFVDLQERRHAADDDPNERLTRTGTNDLVRVAENAFAAWRPVRSNPAHRTAVELFLTSLLLWERWGKG
jgi:hypothetical protein